MSILEIGPVASQNVAINGVTSKVFIAYFCHSIKQITSDYQLYIESVLSNFMDHIGDSFSATFYLNTSDTQHIDNSLLELRYNSYHSIFGVGKKLSNFLYALENNVITNVTLYIPITSLDTSIYTNSKYTKITLMAKNGVYID